MENQVIVYPSEIESHLIFVLWLVEIPEFSARVIDAWEKKKNIHGVTAFEHVLNGVVCKDNKIYIVIKHATFVF